MTDTLLLKGKPLAEALRSEIADKVTALSLQEDKGQQLSLARLLDRDLTHWQTSEAEPPGSMPKASHA